MVLAVLVPFIGIPLLIFQHFGQIKSWLAGIWSDVVGGVRGFVGSVGSVIGTIGGVIRNGFSGAISFIKGLPGEALQWGADIINGIVSGIKSAVGAVGNAVKGVAQNIRNFLHFSKPDTGPLADFDTYMPDMMGTMAKGITGNIGKLKVAAKGAAAAISGGLKVSANLAPAYAGASSLTPSVQQSSPSVTRSANTVININNPVAEKSSDSVRKQMTRLAYMGVLS
jgi:phage-related protein